MLGKDSFLSGLHSTMVTNYKRAKNSDMPCPYSTNLPNCFSLTSTVYWKRASQGHLSLSQKDKSKCAFQTQVGVVGLFTREEFWLKLCISRQFGRQDSTVYLRPVNLMVIMWWRVRRWKQCERNASLNFCF